MNGPLGGSIDIKQVTTAMLDVPSKNKQYLAKTLRDLQTLYLDLIKGYAPRDTGAYGDSWRRGEIKGNVAYIRSPMGKLYKILEFTGANPGIRKPRKARALRFTIDGVVIYAMSVYFPGFLKIPHVRPAKREFMRHARLIMYANLDTYSTRLFDVKRAKQQAKVKVGNLRVRRVVNKKAGKKKFRSRTIVNKNVRA